MRRSLGGTHPMTGLAVAGWGHDQATHYAGLTNAGPMTPLLNLLAIQSATAIGVARSQVFQLGGSCLVHGLDDMFAFEFREAVQ
jgi:hypothetical protein